MKTKHLLEEELYKLLPYSKVNVEDYVGEDLIRIDILAYYKGEELRLSQIVPDPLFFMDPYDAVKRLAVDLSNSVMDKIQR